MATKRIRELQARLDEIADREKRAGIRDETPEWLAANAALDREIRATPWWRRTNC